MITRRKLVACGAAGLMSPEVLRRVARADAPAGTIVALHGACTVERRGQATPLKTGDAVALTETIAVPADGKLKLRLGDGSVLSLASGTRMTIAALQTGAGGQRENVQLSLGQGLLRAVVAPVDHPSQFEISTAVGTAAVRSTDWFVEIQPSGMQVGVLAGAVSLTSGATKRSVAIPARWGARLEAGRDPVMARVWTPDEFQAVITRTDVL